MELQLYTTFVTLLAWKMIKLTLITTTQQ